MINLLPPSIKEQVYYAKKNTVLTKMIGRLTWVVVLLAVTFAGAFWHLNRTLAETIQARATKEARISDFAKTEQNAQALSQRVAAVKNLQKKQTRFSLLLADLARVTPSGAYINTIALTEDTKKPVSISATADSYRTAAGLRDALASSPRIEAVDIGNITNPEPGNYVVTLTIGFKQGQFK